MCPPGQGTACVTLAQAERQREPPDTRLQGADPYGTAAYPTGDRMKTGPVVPGPAPSPARTHTRATTAVGSPKGVQGLATPAPGPTGHQLALQCGQGVLDVRLGIACIQYSLQSPEVTPKPEPRVTFLATHSWSGRLQQTGSTTQ